MKIGVMYIWRAGQPLNEAARLATQNFETCSLAKGHYPAELHFNPAQLPDDLEIGGLNVLPDDQVPCDRIRVCTCEYGNELAAERVAVAWLISEATV